MTYARLGTALALSLFSAHCGDPSTQGDAAVDASAEGGMDVPVIPPCEATFMFETGSPTGHPMPLGASATEARAGLLTAADLPTDPTGLATYAPGDYVLANDHVAFIIEARGPSQLHDPWGGKPIGLARVRGGRLVEAADFNEVILTAGRYIVEPESVAVLRDGAAGGPAVVRAVGTYRPLPFLDEFARALAPFDYRDIRVAVDYTLEPGADHVDIHTTYEIRRNRPTEIRPVIHAFFQRYRMPRFSPVTGFADNEGTVPYVAFTDDATTGYAWMSVDGDLTSLISVSGFDGYTSSTFVLPACAQTRRHTARLVAAGPGLDPIVQAAARIRNERQREVTGAVTEAGGAPAAGVRVHATSPDGRTYYTRTRTNADGTFTLHVPDATAARLAVWREGEGAVASADAAVGAGPVALRMPAPAFVRVVATETGATGGAIPVRVQLIPVGAAIPEAPAEFGERAVGNGRARIAFPTNGDVTLRVAPGTYRVVVSRGYEYEIHEATVTVGANETAMVSASLRRSVDTAGVVCGDFHIHTHRSPDAPDDAALKLTSLVADGLEIPVRSDHEFVADFQPLIRDLGLETFARGVPSLELTTFTWGHFGVVPLPPDPTQRNGGAFEWANRTPQEVFAEARARPSAPTIIINHPRSSGAQGYFSAARFDPMTGTGARAGYWDEAFTAVEVFNDSDFESNRAGTVNDWFSLLAHGRRVFAVGSSDSHSIAGSPVGYPRTCMFLGTDDPRMASDNAVRDAAARGRSTISGGVYVTAVAPGNMGPGQDATGVGASANVRVTVQAPTWVTAQRLEVIVDGATVQTLALDNSTADPSNPVVRFRRDVPVPVAAPGSWVVFAVHSSTMLEPVHPGRPAFGVTNPIFLRR